MGRHFLAAVFLAGALVPWLAQAEDLLDVYAQARQADPVWAGATAVRNEQAEVAVQARARLLPQWQLSVGEARTEAAGTPTQTLTSTLSQTLFDLSQLREWDATQTLVSAQDLRVRAAEQDLCARVATAYFGVLSAQASLDTARANEDAFAAQVYQAQKRFESGLAAQLDVEQARTYRALSHGAVLQAAEALADARATLAQITGRPPGVLKALAPKLDALPPLPLVEQSWVDQALRGNPQLQAQALGLKASELRVDAARAAHYPTLSLGLNTNRSSGAAVAAGLDGRTQSTLGLQLTIPLLAGGGTESAKRQAAYQRDAVNADTEATRRLVIRNTQAQYQAVLTGMALMESAQLAVQASTTALASTRAGQALGTRSMTDLLLAIQTQTSAQTAWEQARHRYVLAKLYLQQAVGALGAEELAAINRLLLERGET